MTIKALITGGAGFIGSHLVDLLVSANIEVTVLDNFSTGRLDNLNHIKSKIKIHKSDLCIDNNLEVYTKDIDWVIHLAALADIVPSIQNPEAYYNVNVNGTFRLLQACVKSNVSKFIYAGSSSCYGIPKIFPTPETAKINPQYPYALTKRLGEELVMHWCKVYKIPSISLRFFNVYGPRSRTSGTYGAVFGVFLAQKLANKPFTIVGDGSQTRDFTFVTDITKGILKAVKSNYFNKIYNLGSGKTVSINYLTKLLKGETVNIPKRPGEPEKTFADISKIRKELNWEPVISIEEGVSIILKNIDYWHNAPVWTPSKIEEETKDWFKSVSYTHLTLPTILLV